jgi:hypothetical protein
LELQLPQSSSEDGKKTEHHGDGFSDYVQATVKAPTYEPRIETEEDPHYESPSPIVPRNVATHKFAKTSAAVGIPKLPSHQEKIQKDLQQVVHVHPILDKPTKISIPNDDDDFGQIIDESPKKRTHKLKEETPE